MDKMLTETEAAPLVGLAASTLQKMRVFGTGPKFAKLGRAVRYRECDLQTWLQDRVVSSTSEVVELSATPKDKGSA
jgi:predicted DNA-binding transcriptional regulator AlpA